MSLVGCSLQEIIARKDAIVRLLESRSYRLLCFTYEVSESKERSNELNTALENHLEKLLFAAHQELALYRIQSDSEDTYKKKLQHLHTLASELDESYSRFEYAKANLPNDRTAITVIFGPEDLQSKTQQTIQGLGNLNKALEGSQSRARELLERKNSLTHRLAKLAQVQQDLVRRFTLVVNLVNQFASISTNCARNETAEKVLEECLFRIAVEFNWQDWTERIKKVTNSLDEVKPITETKTPFFGSHDRDKFIYETLASQTETLKLMVRRTDSLLKLVEKLLN